jgi:hypothetical protein
MVIKESFSVIFTDAGEAGRFNSLRVPVKQAEALLPVGDAPLKIENKILKKRKEKE